MFLRCLKQRLVVKDKNDDAVSYVGSFLTVPILCFIVVSTNCDKIISATVFMANEIKTIGMLLNDVQSPQKQSLTGFITIPLD